MLVTPRGNRLTSAASWSLVAYGIQIFNLLPSESPWTPRRSSFFGAHTYFVQQTNVVRWRGGRGGRLAKDSSAAVTGMEN